MRILIFLGSTRESTPPSPARLGYRVAKFVEKTLKDEFSKIESELIDPLSFDLAQKFKPHFAYDKKSVPKDLDELAKKIENTDAFIMLSPEYNHSMSPALSHLLNHFGSSLFSYKPSLIITYSAGQWGGARACTQMRTFLGELGCLPVSSMLHVPKAQEIFHEDGSLQQGQDQERWSSYFSRAILQLEWWGQATLNHRKEVNPFAKIKAFKASPSQRNAPD